MVTDDLGQKQPRFRAHPEMVPLGESTVLKGHTKAHSSG